MKRELHFFKGLFENLDTFSREILEFVTFFPTINVHFATLFQGTF